MRAAVYAGTRNVYQDMIPSMKSLLIHSNVLKIYFLILDDLFPYLLPPVVECINVSNQTWFLPNTPNIKNRCSYMVLLRVVFSKIFPHLDKILTIDNDTIVQEDISLLWELNLDNYYVAGAILPRKSKSNALYINMGVAMLNLNKIREDKLDDKLIYDLNNFYFYQAEQDAINYACQGHILEISSAYNCNNYTKNTIKIQKIVHFAATKNWQQLPITQYYRDIEITKNKKYDYELEIIIPTYNDFYGLENTLKSVYYPNLLLKIHITVVDDASQNQNYLLLEFAYPLINFILLKLNSGPAIARQTGINATSSKYLMFIDSGDLLTSLTMLHEILNIILTKYIYKILTYAWINLDGLRYCKNNIDLLHGAVFKRDFLLIHNITFGNKESYSNLDRGFMIPSKCILKNQKRFEKINYIYLSKLPLIYYTYNLNSITHLNNGEFYKTKHIRGIVYNYEHAIKICQNNSVSLDIIGLQITYALIWLYLLILQCAKNNIKDLNENWSYVKYFYENIYKPYKYIVKPKIDIYYHKAMPKLYKLTSPYFVRVNIYKFLDSLEQNEIPPLKYD